MFFLLHSHQLKECINSSPFKKLQFSTSSTNASKKTEEKGLWITDLDRNLFQDFLQELLLKATITDMAVGKKYFDSATLLQVTLALSMMRPELQGFVGQNTTPPMPVNLGYPQNYTGVAFAPSSTSNLPNFHLAAKEAAANYNNPLSEFLDWHTTGQNQFDSDAIAMLFNGESHAPREARTSFSTELESGYSSDGGRSPSALSSVGGSPQHEANFGDVQTPEADFFGATGFTPTEDDLLKSLDFELEDFIDLDSIYEGPPQKKAFLPDELPYPNIKTEPLPSPDDTYGRKFPNSPQDLHVLNDPDRKNPFEEPFNFEGFEGQFYNPFSIDFAPTNEELQQPGTETDTVFDFDSFADNIDYNTDLPLDLFDPRPQGQTQAVENKHDNLLPLGQEPLPIFSEATATRNDSGFPSTGTYFPSLDIILRKKILSTCKYLLHNITFSCILPRMFRCRDFVFVVNFASILVSLLLAFITRFVSYKVGNIC